MATELSAELDAMSERGCAWHGAWPFPSATFGNSFGFFFFSKRAELKLQSEEEQARAAALNKEYQATYRERHRANLATQAKKRRYKAYQDRYGFAMFNLYMRAHRERRRMADARRRAQEGYHSGDDSDNGDNSDKETEANDRRSS
ncbi:hypothetical protein B0H13DRAFT_2309762 [Mycena leptocephala]|nr:hypothetical protein B0H13DRAFT_2309762 [Mycena leptocephala]